MVLTDGIKERMIQTSDNPTEIEKIFEKILVNGYSSLSLYERQLHTQYVIKLTPENRKKMDEFCNDEVSNRLYVHPKPDGGTNEIRNIELKAKNENIKFF